NFSILWSFSMTSSMESLPTASHAVLSQLLNDIINIKVDEPAFSLHQLINSIDSLLACYDSKL
ncbi:hypothetical protein KI387_034932, partial [Taxus chinensis]